jgi:hypothetical protein
MRKMAIRRIEREKKKIKAKAMFVYLASKFHPTVTFIVDFKNDNFCQWHIVNFFFFFNFNTYIGCDALEKRL